VPVADTQLLFGLDPKDRHHGRVMELIAATPGLVVPDTAVLEFAMVLRARGRSAAEVSEACAALIAELADHDVGEASTIDLAMIVDAAEIEQGTGLSYFDAMIAASARALDSVVVSDDDSFERVQGLERIPVAPGRGRRATRDRAGRDP
jgi:predicted nucleic acid-binding protein